MAAVPVIRAELPEKCFENLILLRMGFSSERTPGLLPMANRLELAKCPSMGLWRGNIIYVNRLLFGVLDGRLPGGIVRDFSLTARGRGSHVRRCTAAAHATLMHGPCFMLSQHPQKGSIFYNLLETFQNLAGIYTNRLRERHPLIADK